MDEPDFESVRWYDKGDPGIDGSEAAWRRCVAWAEQREQAEQADDVDRGRALIVRELAGRSGLRSFYPLVAMYCVGLARSQVRGLSFPRWVSTCR